MLNKMTSNLTFYRQLASFADMKLSFVFCLIGILNVLAAAVVSEGVHQQHHPEQLMQLQSARTETPIPTTSRLQKAAILYEYDCFNDKRKKDVTTNGLAVKQSRIGLQVTDHVTHQIITRIFAIFLREILNYRNVYLIPLRYKGNDTSAEYETSKLIHTLSLIRYHPEMPDMQMINLEVWMPPVGHLHIPQAIYEAGQSISPGRYGWYVPDMQSSSDDSLDYHVFFNATNPHYRQYVLNDDVLHYLRKDGDTMRYISPKCKRRSCCTLIAEHRYDSAFVESQIEQTESYVNVLWLGVHFREKLKWLFNNYISNHTYEERSYIVLHWTPSDIIDGDINYRQITMPRCEDYSSLQNAACKYELTPLLKYYSKSLQSNGNERILYALNKFMINHDPMHDIFKKFESQREMMNASTQVESIYNAVSCNWIKRNAGTFNQWISKEPSSTLSIGGIFPMTDTSRGHQNLVLAARRAVQAINRNRTILANYNLVVLENDGQCKADMVMKAFIHYFNLAKVLGVLGPACSETVEPIAGISKHTSTAVISYSAEGASFLDREAYPFFFRTIGSNRQYADVYITLMQHLKWRRVAALTEDGQKYTEYISHMDTAMKQKNLELIINKKFLSDVTSPQMNKYLLDLKQRHAKIIIADIHTANAQMALCEAYKLGMTAHEGYVWFLPSWISKNFNFIDDKVNDSCTGQHLQMAFEGHFSIMHAPFGDPESIMQENITIAEWLNTYQTGNESVSNYTGFAYDAIWAYALAANKLLQENPEAINNLRSSSTVKRFVELIWQTDFEGLSGRVRFGEGGSRITDLNIIQWRNGQFIEVGKFYPHVDGEASSLHTNGGKLVLHDDLVQWLSSNKPPSDGTYDCSFSDLAELMGTDCDSAVVAFTAISCVLAVIIISLISFLFWKRRYDKKLKRSAKIMKNFGIDLLSPSRSKGNTLDKWEIPKENVVINRRLGEGAFGTVYGGEAKINSQGWTAVAVKTLKVGASTEDRLDFLSEAEAMKRFNHKNIVKLLGVCLQSEPIYTIMEFMLYGDLKTYLLARRHLVNDKMTDESDISAKRLTMYAMDVARGLAYLAQQKYVHRDVACRNCLVCSEKANSLNPCVVKLGDFGMARPTYESDYYRFNRKGMLPVRWMAPESLALGLFTPSSDVWAFGVVVYEIITFGSFPYQGLTNNQVLEYVKSGKTLQIPTGVKPQLEGLLKACWSQEAKKRPTASEVIEYISNYPRLLTPCLDFPGASVEMPETESDELELLPKARKCSPTKKDSTLDILAQTNSVNDFERHSDFGADEIDVEMDVERAKVDLPNVIVNTPAINMDTFSPITPDGYSIMSPLLMHQVSECSDSSQAHLIKKSFSDGLQQTSC